MYAKDILVEYWHKCHYVNDKLNTLKILKTFGGSVKSARSSKGYSQEKLALDTELDLTTINEIEKGHRSPKLVTVCKIAYGLGLKPSELLKNL